MTSSSDTTLQELDARIRSLRAQTQGLKGAVLAQAEPGLYSDKLAELDSALREHYQLLFGDSVSMP